MSQLVTAKYYMCRKCAVLHMVADRTQVCMFCSILPLFLVLSHTPFYAQDKKISVRICAVACLFPVPVVVWFHVSRFLGNKNPKHEMATNVTSWGKYSRIPFLNKKFCMPCLSITDASMYLESDGLKVVQVHTGGLYITEPLPRLRNMTSMLTGTGVASSFTRKVRYPDSHSILRYKLLYSRNEYW